MRLTKKISHLINKINNSLGNIDMPDSIDDGIYFKYNDKKQKSNRLIAMVVVLAVLLFIGVVFIGPFKGSIFSLLFPKPGSQASSNFPYADTAFPTAGQNWRRNDRSPFNGPHDGSKVQKLWEFRKPNDVAGSASFVGATIGQNNTAYFSAGFGGIFAVDTGPNPVRADRFLWNFVGDPGGNLAKFTQYAPTVASDGNLYSVNEAGNVYDLSPNRANVPVSQRVIWHDFSTAGVQLHTATSISPDGKIVVVTNEAGDVMAFDRVLGPAASNGGPLWKTHIKQVPFGTARRIPIVFDSAGNMYGTVYQTMFSLDSHGNIRWQQDMNYAAPSSKGYVITTGPALSDDGQTLYFVQGNYIIAVNNLNSTTGSHVKWTLALKINKDNTGTPDDAGTRSPSLGVNGIVYVGSKTGWLNAIQDNGTTGTVIWKKMFRGGTDFDGVKSNILIDASGVLYFTAGKGTSGDGTPNSPYRIWAVDSNKAPNDSQNAVDPMTSGYNYANSTNSILWSSPAYFSNDEYQGQELALDSNGTLYSPLGKEAVGAFKESGATQQSPSPSPSSTASPSPSPSLSPSPSAIASSSPGSNNGVMFGAWVGAAHGSNTFGDVPAFEQITNKVPKVRHIYYSNVSDANSKPAVPTIHTNPDKMAQYLQVFPMRPGEILFVSWATDDAINPITRNMAQMANGSADSILNPFIHRWAVALASTNNEVWINPFWEENACFSFNSWWCSPNVGNQVFKTVYRKVVQQFQSEFRTLGKTNVKYMVNFNKSNFGDLSSSYPGDDVNDYLSFDAYPSNIASYQGIYPAVASVSPNKDIVVVETGTTVGTDPAAMTSFLSALPTTYPRVKAWIWFDENCCSLASKLSSFSPAFQQAFKNSISSYIGAAGGGGGGPSPSPSTNPSPSPSTNPSPSPSTNPSPSVSPSPSPSASPNPCVITNASWNTTLNPVTAGASVGLTVTTSGNCSGKQVNFKIQKDNGVLPPGSVAHDPGNVTISGASTNTTWIAEYIGDASSQLSSYYFNASIVGLANTSKKSTNPELQVKPITGPVLTITTPMTGQLIIDNLVTALYTPNNSNAPTGVKQADFTLDQRPKVQDTSFTGSLEFNSVPVGNHTLSGYLADVNNTKITGSDAAITFTTLIPPFSTCTVFNPNARFNLTGSIVPANLTADGQSTATITLNSTSNQDACSLVDIEMYDQSGQMVFQQLYDFEPFFANQPNVYDSIWDVPTSLNSGVYTAKAKIFAPGVDPATASPISVNNNLAHITITSPGGGGSPSPSPKVSPSPTVSPSVSPSPSASVHPSASPSTSPSPSPSPLNSPSPSPSIPPLVCSLNTATWSTLTAVTGDVVTLTVNSNSNCEGKIVNFEVRRNGISGVDDIPAQIQPAPGQIANNVATTTWVAEHNPFVSGTDPDYYFNVNVVGQSEKIQSNPRNLHVTVPGGPGPSPSPSAVVSPSPSPSASTSSTCNKNGACEANLGEDCNSCSEDCGACPNPSSSPSSSSNPSHTGDINGDGHVDVTDLSIMLSDFNGHNSRSDLNNDGIVDVTDLSILLSNWGG